MDSFNWLKREKKSDWTTAMPSADSDILPELDIIIEKIRKATTISMVALKT